MSAARDRADVRIEPMALLAVAVGGALGATARYAIGLATDQLGIALPWATLTVNLVGCLLMGVLVSYVLAHPGHHPLWRPFLGAGVLGGFTTFSAFAGDAVLLADEGAWAASAAYVVTTLAGGLLALWVGYGVGHALRRRRPVT